MRSWVPPGTGLRQVGPERVEEVDEVVADGLVGRDVLDRRLRQTCERAAQVLEREQRVRVLGQRLERLEQLLEVVAQLGRLLEGGHAGGERAVDQRQRAGAARRRPAGGVARRRRSGPGTASAPGTRRSQPSSVGGVSSIVCWSAAGSRLSAAKVSARSPNSWACTSATGATCGRRRAERREQVAQLAVAGSTGCASPGSGAPGTGRSWRIVSLMSAPRPANESPKPISAFWASGACAGRRWTARPRARARAATALRSGTVAPSSNVRSERPGSSSTYLRPSAERGPHAEARVDRERLDVLVQLQLELGDASAPGRRPAPDTVMSSTAPDAEAAGPHLVAGDELGAVGDLGVELVGRDERQALIGVVGDEDRDDRHEHGHGPDQDRAGGELSAGASLMAPSR